VCTKTFKKTSEDIFYTAATMDALGDKIKAKEQEFTGERLDANKPMVVRLDGKAFHTFCRGLEKPFDPRLVEIMKQVTVHLMKECGADVGYVQSDEITLVWWHDNENSQPWFGGKRFKIVGELAAVGSLWLNKEIEERIPEKSFSSTGKFQRMDCRLFACDDREEALDAVRWRVMDAVKNSVSMAASAYFPHKELLGKSTSKRMEMLSNVGHPWESLPRHLKEGTAFIKNRKLTKFSANELEQLPAKHAARTNPELMIERGVVEEVEIHVLFKQEEAI